MITCEPGHTHAGKRKDDRLDDVGEYKERNTVVSAVLGSVSRNVARDCSKTTHLASFILLVPSRLSEFTFIVIKRYSKLDNNMPVCEKSYKSRKLSYNQCTASQHNTMPSHLLLALRQ